MKTQSAAYKAAMAKRIRPASLLKVSVSSGGLTYTFRENSIIRASVVDEIDPLSRRLPTQTFSFTVADPTGEYNPANPSGKWLAFDKDAEVSVQFGLNLGGTETFLAADIYWLDGRPSSQSGTVTFQASGRLGRLTGLYYKDPSSVSYNAAVTSILTDAGLTSTDYNIDSYELSRRIGATTGFKPCTYAEALQYFAHASGMALYTRQGKVCMQRFINISPEPTYDPAITKKEIQWNGMVLKKEDLIGDLRKRSYLKKAYTGNTETLWTGTIYLGSTSNTKTYHFEFDDPITDITVTSSSGTIDSQAQYTYAIDLTITGSGNTNITITGEYLDRETNDTTETIGTGSTEEVLENPLLNFNSSTDLAAAWLVQDYEYYLPKRNTYAVTMRGNDAIEAGDSIAIELDNGVMCALVLGVRTEYNGAISTVLTVKEMKVLTPLAQPEAELEPTYDEIYIFTDDLRTEEYKIKVDGTLSVTVQCDGSTTVISDAMQTLNLTTGTHTISIIASATGAQDSIPYELSVTVCSVTYNLTNCTKGSSAPDYLFAGASSSITFAADTGYTLPNSITVTGATLEGWVPSLGAAGISNVTGNVTITIVAQAATLAAPTLDMIDGKARAITTDLNTQKIAFFFDGTIQIAEVNVE